MMVFPILNAVGLKQVDMGCVPLSVDVMLAIFVETEWLWKYEYHISELRVD